MYAIVMIFNTLTVNKCKLIDLLQSGKRSEKVRLKNPLLCTIVFIISASGLGYAYHLVTVGATTLTYASDILFPIGIGIVTTFFIFWSLSGLILFIVMKMKGVYFKGLNSFTFRQVSSKINTTVVSMTTICIMLFLTICILASALSINNSMTANLKTLAPVDIELYKTRNISDEKGQQIGYSSEQIEDSYISIEESLEKLDIHVNDYFTDMVKTFMYTSNEVVFGTTLGSKLEQIKERFPLMSYDTPEEIMKISDYNKIASLYGNETYTLEDNEYMIVADYDSMVEIRNEALQAEEPITFNNKTFYPKYKECKNGFVDISSNHINVGIILVPDHAVTEEMVERELLIANYNTETGLEKKDIEDMIVNSENHPNAEYVFISAVTKLSIYEASVGLGALVTFIGLYLGIIFLVSSAAILALKELSESSDNKERFKVLRKLGADESMINKALFRQIFICFLFPLIFAVIHSVFGILFCNFLLTTMGTGQMLISILTTAALLIVIYGGYFILTYICSKNIIREKY